MNRLAIIIGSPSSPKTPEAGKYLKGVKTDVENIYGFLRSSIGGSWQENELKIFSPNPNYSDVLPYLKACKDVDFAFVYFSGHGYTDTSDKGRVLFNPSQAPYIKYLATRAKRQITIIDACRSYPEFIGFEGTTLIEGINFPNPKPEFARVVYDKYLSQIPASRVLLHATSKGKFSKDYGTNYGGLFSTSLLSVVKNKLDTENKPVFNVAEVFQTAKINTQQSESTQVPQIYISNESAYRLPFAIKPDYKPQQIKSYDRFVNENLAEDIVKGALMS